MRVGLSLGAKVGRPQQVLLQPWGSRRRLFRLQQPEPLRRIGPMGLWVRKHPVHSACQYCNHRFHVPELYGQRRSLVPDSHSRRVRRPSLGHRVGV